MREIFAEEARDRNYEENKADIISELSNKMDRNRTEFQKIIAYVTKMEHQNGKVLQLLKEIQGGNEQMKDPNINEKMQFSEFINSVFS